MLQAMSRMSSYHVRGQFFLSHETPLASLHAADVEFVRVITFLLKTQPDYLHINESATCGEPTVMKLAHNGQCIGIGFAVCNRSVERL